MAICCEFCLHKMVTILWIKRSQFTNWICTRARCTPYIARVRGYSRNMPHHDHVVFKPPDLSIVSILKLIDEFAVQRVSLYGFPFPEHHKHLIIRCPTGETCVLYVPGLIWLTHNHVSVGLCLKHSDLAACVRHQESVPCQVESHINWLIWLILILQIYQQQQAILLWLGGRDKKPPLMVH